MCALVPRLFPTFELPFGEPINHEQNYMLSTISDPQTQQSSSFPHHNILPSNYSDIELILDRSASFTDNYSDTSMVKKLNHNASERCRRKKINNLYSSLRSLLPQADQTKKLSIPTIVSHVLEYIPELQQEVERLTRKKEELILSEISRQDNLINQGKSIVHGSLSSTVTVSASLLRDKEIMVQISTDHKIHNIPFSTILVNLEENRLVPLSTSSFESSGGKVFYNLHLQVEGALECEALRKKIASSLYNMEIDVAFMNNCIL